MLTHRETSATGATISVAKAELRTNYASVNRKRINDSRAHDVPLVKLEMSVPPLTAVVIGLV